MGKNIFTHQPRNFEPAADEMTEHELNEVTGGIIVIGGKYVQLKPISVNSVINRVAINPQPLPPKELRS